MLLQYTKQAWQLLKQNRFYSIIYILGTALSITLVMVLAIILHIKTANIYPETNRNRMWIVTEAEETDNHDNRQTYYLSWNTLNQCFYSLNTAEAVTAIYTEGEEGNIQLPESEENQRVKVKSVDDAFWRVFSFSFLNGKPFGKEELQSGIQTAVVSESLARQLFGKTDAAGEYFQLNFEEFRVCGVVKDVSYAANNTFGDLWIPYTANIQYRRTYPDMISSAKTVGPFAAYILASTQSDLKEIRDEIIRNVHRYNSSLTDREFSIYGQPDKQWQSIFRRGDGMDIDFSHLLFQYGFIFLILMLIPSIGFSGMADSQMGQRIAEIGVRRSFGATRFTLINQLVNENLLFTLIGGLLGLLLSYLCMYLTRHWILNLSLSQVSTNSIPQSVNEVFPLSSLINYQIFFIALIVCILLNLLSAIIPAWRTTRHQIVESLNAK